MTVLRFMYGIARVDFRHVVVHSYIAVSVQEVASRMIPICSQVETGLLMSEDDCNQHFREVLNRLNRVFDEQPVVWNLLMSATPSLAATRSTVRSLALAWSHQARRDSLIAPNSVLCHHSCPTLEALCIIEPGDPTLLHQQLPVGLSTFSAICISCALQSGVMSSQACVLQACLLLDGPRRQAK